MSDLQLYAWDKSYENKDNFVFYPHEEIIRFVSKYIRKRIGLNEFIDISKNAANSKILNFGCGIGRHIKMLNEYRLEVYGFDISENAIKYAKKYFKDLGLNILNNKIQVNDIQNLSYDDNYFDFMLSHGVLDSMTFEVARNGIIELSRCLVKGGLIYFDVISTEDSSFDGKSEKLVTSKHEKNTIQSYFNQEKIKELVQDYFKIVELIHVKRINEKKHQTNARYSVIIKKI